MAGRTPWKASEAFLDPLRLALSSVANAKITTSYRGSGLLGKVHSWAINDGEGTPLRGGFHLEATMNYEIVEVDAEMLGPYKIKTHRYVYSLYNEAGAEMFGIHWHPGSPGYSEPHVHLGEPLRRSDGPLPARHHLFTPRMTFEAAIRWGLECGAEPIQANWKDRLALAEAPHILYRSWHQSPAEADDSASSA